MKKKLLKRLKREEADKIHSNSIKPTNINPTIMNGVHFQLLVGIRLVYALVSVKEINTKKIMTAIKIIICFCKLFSVLLVLVFNY